MLTVAVADSLAVGALLAILPRTDQQSEQLRQLLRRIILPVGLAAYVVLLALADYGIDHHAKLALGQTAEAFVFCWLIDGASRGFGGGAGRLLEWRPIAYLGKISYGIYIFHYLVPPALRAAGAWVGLHYPDRGPFNFVVASLITFGIAALSWEMFEARVNGLKRYFPYNRAAGSAKRRPPQSMRTAPRGDVCLDQ